MNEDTTNITDERLKRIRETPEDQRTGEDMAIIGIDNAVNAAQEALTAAGFKLDHLMLVYDASESPDKNPDSPLMGMVIVPTHQECAVLMLAGAMASVTGAEVDMSMVGGGGQSGPIHHQ